MGRSCTSAVFWEAAGSSGMMTHPTGPTCVLYSSSTGCDHSSTRPSVTTAAHTALCFGGAVGERAAGRPGTTEPSQAGRRQRPTQDHGSGRGSVERPYSMYATGPMWTVPRCVRHPKLGRGWGPRSLLRDQCPRAIASDLSESRRLRGSFPKQGVFVSHAGIFVSHERSPASMYPSICATSH